MMIIFFVAASNISGGSSSYAVKRCIVPAFVGRPSKMVEKQNIMYSCAQGSYSSDLDTAYEWLSSDRDINWFETSTQIDDKHNDVGTEIKRMPLYPLGAVHIPYSGENNTIINIEQKNVKMAMDLANGGKWENSLFNS